MPVTLRQRVAKRARQRPAAEPRGGSGGGGGEVGGDNAGAGSSGIHGTQETCAKRLEALMEKCFGDLQFLLDEFAKLEVVVSPVPEVDTAGTPTDSKLGRLRFFTNHVRRTMARMRDARSGRDPLSMPQLALLEEHIAISITPVKARLVRQLRCGSLSLSLDSAQAGDGGDGIYSVSSSSSSSSSVNSSSVSSSGGGGGIMSGSSGGSADDGGSTSRSSSVSSSLGGLGGESPSQDGDTEAGGGGGGYIGQGGIVCSVGMDLNGHIFGAAINSSGGGGSTAGGLDAAAPFGEREPKKKRATDRLAQHRRDNLDMLSQLEAEGVFAADDSYSPCRAGLYSASSHPFMLSGTPYGRDAPSPCEFSRVLGGVEPQGKVEGLRPFSARAARQGDGQQKQASESIVAAAPIEVKRELWADERAVIAVSAAASPSPPPPSPTAASGVVAGAGAAAAVGASSRGAVPMAAVATTTTVAGPGAAASAASAATNARTLAQETASTSSASTGPPGRVQGPTPTPSVRAVAAAAPIVPKQEPMQAPAAYSVTRVAHGSSVAAATGGVSTGSVAAAAAAAAAAVVVAEGAPTPSVWGASTERADAGTAGAAVAAAAAAARAAAVSPAGANGVAFSTAYQGQPQPLRSGPGPGPVTAASGVCATCVAGSGGRGAAPALPAPLLGGGGGGGGGGMLVAPRQPKRRRSSAFPAALLQPREVRYQCGACSESYTATVTGNPWWLLVRQECQACHKMQIPRVDILNPTNNVEGHIAFLTEACAENGADGDGSCMDWDGDTSDENSGDDCSDDERDAQGFFAGTFAGDEGEAGSGKKGIGPTLDSEQAAKLLVLMCHARGCPGNHHSPRLAEVCRSVKFLMLHLRDCDGRTRSGQPCPMPWCQPCTSLLHHLIRCPESAACQVCNPLHLPSPLRDLRILNHSGNAQEQARHAATLQETHAGRVSATGTATQLAPTPFAQHAPDRAGQ